MVEVPATAMTTSLSLRHLPPLAASPYGYELHVDGEPRQLTAAVELAGYRVVQESLTNAIRYAPGAATRVHLAYRADGVMVDVIDDGPGTLTARTAGQGGGTGLAGLRERAHLAGGWLEAASGPEEGFAVRAFLPDTR